MDDDPELLYEDLFENLENGQAVIKSSFLELEERIQEVNREKEDLQMQINGLQSQNQKLSKQNEVLIRNISCLFKTAQMEIARKDKQIRSLQEEALRSSLNANRSSVGAVVCTQSPNGSVANQGKDNNGKQIRKYNPTEELLETSFGVRKRMAHDIQGNQNAREKSNDCNKRLQVEDQRSENLRRSREKSIEYNKPLDEAQQRCENYLEPQEKEERALRDHQSMKPLVRSNEVENGNNRSTHVNRHDSGNGIRAGHVRGYDVDNGNHGGNVRGHDVDKVNLGDHLRGRDVDNGNNGGHVKGHDVDDGSCGVQVRGQDVDDRNRGVHVRGHDDRNHGVHGVKNGNYNSRVINSVEQGRKRRPENYIKRVVEEEDWAARDQTRGSRARSQSLHDHHNDGNNGWNDIGTFEQCRKEGSENYISRNHDGNHGNDVIETKERWRRGIEISINRPEEEDRQRRPRR